MKRQRKFGVYLKWPETGTAWIHPEDVLLAEQLLCVSPLTQHIRGIARNLEH